MLADAATVADGKLFVHGGAWDTINTRAFPTTHPTLAVVLHIRVEYDEALIDHEIRVALETEDGEAFGPEMRGVFNAGHAAGTRRGAPSFLPVALSFQGITFHSPSHFVWKIEVDGVPMKTLPMHVIAPSVPPPGV